MPGSSLWLIPPASHPLHGIISDLVSEQLPSSFPDLTGPTFAPHMTLTSNIPPALYGDAPQEWLDSIPWPAARDVQVRFEDVRTEDTFFRRCYIRVVFEGVRSIAGLARARGVNGEETIGSKTEQWLEEWRSAFGPHVSLIYGENPIDEAKLQEIVKLVKSKGVTLAESDSGAQGGLNGWEGGVVWLVPTDKPVGDWKPIATKTL
ncbi:hypothetical protein DL765_001880 [Monosporascus sp. GIB2]|nr:hypothetical protein DL765_001880 [Monosporascus sp. GIB2]